MGGEEEEEGDADRGVEHVSREEEMNAVGRVEGAGSFWGVYNIFSWSLRVRWVSVCSNLEYLFYWESAVMAL